MRILLVTFSDLLPSVLRTTLNLENEICAIVVDEPKTAKEFFEKNNLPAESIYPFYELQECITNFYYDCVICISSGLISWDMHNHFIKCGLPLNKFVHFSLSDENFLVKRALLYYEEHADEIEIFATGISYTSVALDVKEFKYKLLNFGRSSQDLYYDYQIAKRVLTPKTGGTKIRYALIGLAPYSFHLDMSKSYALIWRMLPYFIAFKDLHNFWLSPEVYKSLFNKNYLSLTPSTDNFDINNVNLEKSSSLRFINQKVRLDARKKIDVWKNRNFPATRNENIKILEDYLSLCQSCNVRPIMFLPPMTEGVIKCFSKQKIDEFYFILREVQEKYPAVFIDGRKLKGFDDSDFYDVDHLSIKGAAKFSAMLNNVIEQIEKS